MLWLFICWAPQKKKYTIHAIMICGSTLEICNFWYILITLRPQPKYYDTLKLQNKLREELGYKMFLLESLQYCYLNNFWDITDNCYGYSYSNLFTAKYEETQKKHYRTYVARYVKQTFRNNQLFYLRRKMCKLTLLIIRASYLAIGGFGKHR